MHCRKGLHSLSHSAHSCRTLRLLTPPHAATIPYPFPSHCFDHRNPGPAWQLCGLTGFGCSLCSKVRSKLLEDLCAVFLHEEADEVGGGIELQGQRSGELALPATDGGLQGFPQRVHLAVLTLVGKTRGLLQRQGETDICCYLNLASSA